MMSAEAPEAPARQPPSPSAPAGMDARVEQLVSELRVKVGSVILRARSGGMAGASAGCYGSSVSSSASSSPGLAGSGLLLSGSGTIPDVKRWFNIECAEADGLREELAAQCQQWRGEHGSGSFPPLCVEVIVSVPSSFSAASPPPSPSPAEDGEATQHRIELWVMRFQPDAAAAAAAARREGGAAAAASMETPAMYKRAVILVRALYSLLRFLPGHKIASLHDASVGVAVSSRLLSVEESARALASYPAAPPAPARAAPTSVPPGAAAPQRSAFAARGEAPREAAAPPTTSHGGQTFFNFGALDTPAGRLHTGVMYDSHRAEVVVEAFRHYAPTREIVNRPARVLSAPAARPSFAARSPPPGRRAAAAAAAAPPAAAHRSASFSQTTTIRGFAPQSAPGPSNTGAIVMRPGAPGADITPTRYRKNSNEYPYAASSASGSDSASGSFSTSSPPLPFSETPKSSGSLLFALKEDRPATAGGARAPSAVSPVVSASFLEAATAATGALPPSVVQHALSAGQPVRIPAFAAPSPRREQEAQRQRLRLEYRPEAAAPLSASRHSAGDFVGDDDDLPFALEGEHADGLEAAGVSAGAPAPAPRARERPRRPPSPDAPASSTAARAAAKVAAPPPCTSPQNMLRLVNDALMLNAAGDGMPLRYAMLRIEQISADGFS